MSYYTREVRRAKAIAILDANPDTKRAIITDVDSDPEHVLLTIAIRGQHSFEMKIKRERYDAFEMLKILSAGGGLMAGVANTNSGD